MGESLGRREASTRAVGCDVMMILGIETAVEQVSVALGDHRGLRAEASSAGDRRHAESLTPMIQFVCAQAGITTSEIDAVAVDIGPGLFTGMRVGIATAEMMSWALDIPIIPVCSLDVLAHAVTRSDDLVAACLDARRGEVYWAMYRPGDNGAAPQRLTEPVVTPPSELVALLLERDQNVVCVGTGAERYTDELSHAFRAEVWDSTFSYPTARALVSIAAQKAVREQWVSAEQLEPMYLRAPDAEINWATR